MLRRCTRGWAGVLSSTRPYNMTYQVDLPVLAEEDRLLADPLGRLRHLRDHEVDDHDRRQEAVEQQHDDRHEAHHVLVGGRVVSQDLVDL